MKDLVSIITPSYNASDFIEDCINSVVVQTYSNWEMLIVDDCSEDDSCIKIKNVACKDDRIRFFPLEENVGAAEARNVALRFAKGKYIAFLDADDLWKPEKIEEQVSFMLRNDIAFSYTTYESVTSADLIIKKIIQAPKKMTYHSYLKNTIIGCLTVMLDREKIGDFAMPNIRSSHDMALWLLIMKRGYDAYGLDINLAQYRILADSNTSNKWRAAKDVWRVYRSVEKLSFSYSSWCFLNYAFNALIKRI